MTYFTPQSGLKSHIERERCIFAQIFTFRHLKGQFNFGWLLYIHTQGLSWQFEHLVHRYKDQ